LTTCSSGGACSANGPNNFDGMTAKQITAQVTAMGLKTVPLIFGGSANGGIDTGVQNVLNNTSVAASFITAMVNEAVANGYAGYNLDWEVGSGTGSAYGDKVVAFVNNFQDALTAHGMSLSFDVIASNINGTWCSSNNGFADFAKLASSRVDRIIIEDYTPALGTASNTCQPAPLSSASPIACPVTSDGMSYTAVGLLNFMCSNLPAGKIVIGLESDSGGTNPIAGQLFSVMRSYGFTNVAVWPQAAAGYPLMSTANFVSTYSNWYTQLAAFLH